MNIISTEELARLPSRPDCPTLIDVRTEEDFAAHPRGVPGAIRRAWAAVPASDALEVAYDWSRMYADDLARLEAGLAIYDACYRGCRDAVDEGHDWPPARKA